MTPLPSTRHRRSHGFTLIELLVVVAIIATMAAVALPQISRYIRNYRIRGAAQQVAGDIQAARMKAVMKNVNFGVVWFAWRQTSPAKDRFAWVIEDDQQPGSGTTTDWAAYSAEDLQKLLDDRSQRGGIGELQTDIQFDSPANCPGGVAATDWGMRFNRLGGTCQMVSASTTCPPPGTVAGTYSATRFIAFSGGNVTLCIKDIRTNLRRRITVTSGGRIFVS